eukprot:1480842-Rhodomonas_salina.1
MVPGTNHRRARHGTTSSGCAEFRASVFDLTPLHTCTPPVHFAPSFSAFAIDLTQHAWRNQTQKSILPVHFQAVPVVSAFVFDLTAPPSSRPPEHAAQGRAAAPAGHSAYMYRIYLSADRARNQILSTACLVQIVRRVWRLVVDFGVCACPRWKQPA